MNIKDIISAAGCAATVLGPKEAEVNAMTLDSRKAVAGSLFVAQKGEKVDGHDYILKAVEGGCRAVLCEHSVDGLPADCTVVVVEDTHEALGLYASAFFGNPSQKLKLVGVTGTNGKTTIATLLYRLLTELGHKCGLFSTVANYVAGERTPAMQTTPDAITLQREMRKMVDAGCDYCFMEVSSHSVVQKRIAGLDFDGAVFTNLTHDHLDFHKTFANYIDAKKGFFDGLKKEAFALTNVDDKNGAKMLQNTRARKCTYSMLSAEADFKGEVLEDSMDGMLMRMNGTEAMMQFVGRFNAYNLMAIYGAAVMLGKPGAAVILALSKLRPVDGRFQTTKLANGATAIVDYAHTPDALLNVISTINEVRAKSQTFFCLVGCGGDRDRTKRPEMAHEAVVGADRVIITSDNPRSEEPQDIVNDMLAGLTPEERERTLVIVDRREAIRTAVSQAKSGDIILIAGKGHEDYQEIKGVKHHFSDWEEVNACL